MLMNIRKDAPQRHRERRDNAEGIRHSLRCLCVLCILNEELLKLLQPGFTIVNGAVLLKSQKKLVKGIELGNFSDLTGYECFVNHVHIEDYLGDVVDSDELLKQGLAFAHKTVEGLRSSFPGKRFKVIVAVNESGCNVRFHQIRDGENWLSDDLEKYQEAILVVETPVQK